MTYSVDFRKKVVAYVKDGSRQAEAARRFGISLWCVRDWLGRTDLRACQQGVARQGKLDKEALRARVRAYPEATLQEHAVHCGVDRSTVGKALKRLKITRKKRRSNTQSVSRSNA